MGDVAGESARARAFDVVLYPHRSLSPAGFAILMAAIVAVSAAIGAGFVAIGAWPVSGFLGVDVLLIYAAFQWNYRAARLAEFIRLDRDGLVVRRIEPGGRSREWRFEPYWVRVELVEPRPGERVLLLSAKGERLTIGAFLTKAERVELAAALRAALRPYRPSA